MLKIRGTSFILKYSVLIGRLNYSNEAFVRSCRVEININEQYCISPHLKIKRDFDLGAKTTTTITKLEHQEDLKCFFPYSSPGTHKQIRHEVEP